jgi:hypothetical protein
MHIVENAYLTYAITVPEWGSQFAYKLQFSTNHNSYSAISTMNWG